MASESFNPITDGWKPERETWRDLKKRIKSKLTPVEQIKGGLWLFKCACGNKHKAEMKYVRYGRIKSCGCQRFVVSLEQIAEIRALRGVPQRELAKIYKISQQNINAIQIKTWRNAA